MKNIVSFDNDVQCYSCNLNGFFCYTPQGADYYTCPLCRNYDFKNGSYIFDKDLYDKYFDNKDLYDKNSINDNENNTCDDENTIVDNENNTCDDENTIVDNENNTCDDKNTIVDNENNTGDDENNTGDDEHNTGDDEHNTCDDENTIVDEENNTEDEENNTEDEENNTEDEENNTEDEEISINDIPNFCDSCKIIFKVGCIHACNGCTDDCFNGHLVGKWKYKGEEYIGMPQFDTIDEWLNEINNIDIIEWICPNNGLHCTKGSYPKATYPEEYTICELKKN